MGESNVFIYVPNIIGYIRIILLGVSFYHILDNHRLAIILYSVSYLLDALDGLTARLFNQSSLFGSILDMLTDRVSTMCLLMTLGHLYTSIDQKYFNYFFVFQILLAIDIVSHWLHFFSANIQGKTSHKSSDGETNILIRLYYQSKIILTSVCALEQIFYCSLLFTYYEYEQFSIYLNMILFVSSIALVFKNLVNIIQIWEACRVMVNIDQAHLYHAD